MININLKINLLYSVDDLTYIPSTLNFKPGLNHVCDITRNDSKHGCIAEIYIRRTGAKYTASLWIKDMNNEEYIIKENTLNKDYYNFENAFKSACRILSTAW